MTRALYQPLRWFLLGLGAALVVVAVRAPIASQVKADDNNQAKGATANATQLITQGQQTFRFDTFGDDSFWGDMLGLHRAIEGTALGGVGAGISPMAALMLGLKVDVDALPSDLIDRVRRGQVNLTDPATTLTLLKANAVVGVTGFFNSNGSLQSVGIQCALCHSTVDNAVPLCPAGLQPNPGTGCVGHRLDGWANRDLNVGAIIASAPDLTPLVTLLSFTQPGITPTNIRTVLNSWGPGKFDAELPLDGKAVNPTQVTNGVTTGTNVPGATLIPPAFGLAGVDLHTWTGWGSVPHWNSFVATLEMHGKGRFWDPRLNNSTQFPIAAHFGFGDLPHISPDDDRITSKLAGLQLYQLSIPSPQPPNGSFDAAAAKRGDALFSGKAQCNNCHVEPLWTDPGWNMHTPAEVCIDGFQASRAPDNRYRTSPIGALFTHSKGGFYHDGRFNGPSIVAALTNVVEHYNSNACKSLNLTTDEKSDLVQYLLSLTFGPPTTEAQSEDK